MGYAMIVNGGTDGRYTISLDVGEAERAALVVHFTMKSVEANAKLAAATAELAATTVLLDAAKVEYNEATTAYIALQRGEAEDVETPEDIAAIVNRFNTALRELTAARHTHFVAQSKVHALAFSAAHLVKVLAGWQAMVLTEQRQAWCADFTETATGHVATLEIPGESNLILIAPGGRAPALATDGYLRSRALMSPPQAFVNAALMPGWQKFKPTYRWGTITALNVADDTANVTLGAAISSAQNLDVNQAEALADVPVRYMTCNASAFEVDDRVVVRFVGQNWDNPRVIGFLDNPRNCGPWEALSYTTSATDVLFYGTLSTNLSADSGALKTELYNLATSGMLDGSFRINRGAWVLLSYSVDIEEHLWGPYNGTHLGMSVYYGGGAAFVNAWAGLAQSLGDTIEFRLMQGEVCRFNLAYEIVKAPALECPTKIGDGRITNAIAGEEWGSIPCVQLDYVLFSRSGN